MQQSLDTQAKGTLFYFRCRSLCGGTDYEWRRDTQEVELNNGFFLSFLVLLSSKIFLGLLSLQSGWIYTKLLSLSSF